MLDDDSDEMNDTVPEMKSKNKDTGILGKSNSSNKQLNRSTASSGGGLLADMKTGGKKTSLANSVGL